ncbi:hypothetical protein [Nocardia sp. NRRL S-836]|uniref:hypothetical protein n=1 Tax=Nocardia sp. NRRL S-836 TaxID=1519492 RepID=UPI0006AF3D59|nr:hypothetical protein [Nocardia sp. NRRL S-836]
MTFNVDVAEYRGETFRTSGSEAAPGHVWIIQIAGVTYASEGFEQKGDVRLKQVPIAELDAWYRERATATWRGQPVSVSAVDGGVARVDYLGGSAVWAQDNGLEGDQYGGFYGTIDAAELENVQVDRTDHLARWKKENQG